MVILLTIIHVIVCLFLIIVVLLQSGKAADLAGAFGGMGSQTAFGPRGAATVLTRATTIAAASFMITSLSLSIFATRQQGGGATVLENVKRPATKAPAQQKGGNLPGGITVTPEGGATVNVPLPVDQPKGGTPAPAPAPGKKK